MTGMPPRDAPRADPPRPAARGWEDALAAAALLALDPAGLGGAVLRAGAGPARDRWLEELRRLTPDRRWLRLPPQAEAERLTGGLDLTATLRAGAPRRRAGLLEGDAPLTLVLPMAERLPPSLVAPLAAALDAGRPLLVVALDEGERDAQGDAAPPALRERLALHLSLDGLALAETRARGPDPAALALARRRLGGTAEAEDLVEALAGAAAALGEPSLRAPLFALRAARAAAALEGAAEVGPEAVALAARLTLAPRARRLPAPEEAPPPEAAPDPSPDDAPPPADPPTRSERSERPDPSPASTPQDAVVEAVRAALPAGALERLAAAAARVRRAEGDGAGRERQGAARGRRAGLRPARLRSGVRLDLAASLRAAAPWQGLRRQEAGPGAPAVIVRPSDLRETVRTGRSERLVIFLVDASGSAAMARLAEAKGAVEHLLARAYAARDVVALAAFRGTGAQLLLPPTRALARARRALTALPGGGGTPLAAGLVAARELAAGARRRGATPCLALLTDARANVALDGTADRARAAEDVARTAALIRAEGLPALVVDTALRPGRQAVELAALLGAAHLALPRAEAGALGAAVAARLPARARP
ncbi:magnesium chelatase subunit D [Albimonas pacifica]|uniref:Protoporphyrin IX magnesium-chelatase n=1 Tax=Albimonas pacifica TaxID=1114924 RepID=A0A1I3CPD1_9RHOB|nr:magnesium chelatase subunit D [Albimonas pacifica]SFH76375.1 protoporphyrin IX magnesium-chelatase [Albimonas pacifica]